jgi:ectoine hydroxylase
MQTTNAAVEPATTDAYPSRVHDKPQLLERKDSVLHGEATGYLTPLHRRSYAAKGFLSFRGFFTPEEVARLQTEVNRLRDEEGPTGRDEVIIERSSEAVRSIFAAHRLSPIIDRLARNPRLLKAAQEILGGDVYLHQSRVNYKPAFRGKEFYWHSDFETWHVEDGMPRMRAVSCTIGLTENNEHNGSLLLIPGSHETFVTCVGKTPENHFKSSLKKQEYGVPDDGSLTQLARAGGIEAAYGPAGSVTFFDCNTMHGSNSNISPFPRTNVFFVYNSVENRLQDPFSGQAPRPEHIAHREDAAPLVPA